MQSYEFFLVWAIGVMRWGGWGGIKKRRNWDYVFFGVCFFWGGVL
jgi:hypothetical protein